MQVQTNPYLLKRMRVRARLHARILVLSMATRLHDKNAGKIELTQSVSVVTSATPYLNGPKYAQVQSASSTLQKFCAAS